MTPGCRSYPARPSIAMAATRRPRSSCRCPGQTAISHGRAGAFTSAYAGGNASIPFTNSLASYTTITGTTEPLVPTLAGQTMAETLSAASCAGDTPHCLQNMPSVNLVYTDLWTNTVPATPGTPIALAYDSTLTSNVNWQIPTAAELPARLVLDLPHHSQLQRADSAAVDGVAHLRRRRGRRARPGRAPCATARRMRRRAAGPGGRHAAGSHQHRLQRRATAAGLLSQTAVCP